VKPSGSVIAAATMIACQPPEVEPRQPRDRPRLQEPLRRVIDRREDRVAREREDHRVRVQRAQPAEREVRRDVEAGQRELERAPQPHEHADRAPDQGRGDELADDRVVVAQGLAGHRSGALATGVPPRRIA
jgi:hypothetical protein